MLLLSDFFFDSSGTPFFKYMTILFVEIYLHVYPLEWTVPAICSTVTSAWTKFKLIVSSCTTDSFCFPVFFYEFPSCHRIMLVGKIQMFPHATTRSYCIARRQDCWCVQVGRSLSWAKAAWSSPQSRKSEGHWWKRKDGEVIVVEQHKIKWVLPQAEVLTLTGEMQEWSETVGPKAWHWG